jgi:predicted amidohydrolase YtcJ
MACNSNKAASVVKAMMAVSVMVGALACGGGPAGTPAAAQVADAIYTGGDIVTVNDRQPTAEALAVKAGTIVAVGTRAEVEKAHRGATTQVVDLGGKALLPAFLDAHGHYISALTVANQVNLYAPPAGPGTDPDAIVKELLTFKNGKKVPPGELIQAYGYDENVMPNGNLLNRDHLDQAFPDNPVIVGHVSMHGGVLNSAALKKYGISAATKTPPGGVIVRKPGTQEPYGLIMETAYLGVFAALPKPTREQEAEASKAGQLLYAEAGITLAHEGATHAEELAVMQRATAAGANIIDVVAYPFMTDLGQIIPANPVSGWGRYDNHLKIGGVKITADGSPQGKTAFFTTPFLTGGPGGEKNWRGEPTMPQDDLNTLVKQVYDMNVPLNVHTNGDATIDMFLKAYEFARAGDFSRPWNVTTIHTQFMRKDHIARFVEYKIRPSFYTLHTFYFASAHKANRGEAQAAYLSPMRDAIDARLRPTNHTDFYVAPLDQMFVMWSAVTRMSREGGVLGPDQRITPMEAIKSQTIWAAEQYGEENRRGSLVAGKIADLVVLDGNPTKVDPMAIKDIKVLETIKDGKTIYKR